MPHLGVPVLPRVRTSNTIDIVVGAVQDPILNKGTSHSFHFLIDTIGGYLDRLLTRYIDSVRMWNANTTVSPSFTRVHSCIFKNHVRVIKYSALSEDEDGSSNMIPFSGSNSRDNVWLIEKDHTCCSPRCSISWCHWFFHVLSLLSLSRPPSFLDFTRQN